MVNLDEAIERSAVPATSRRSLERMLAANPDAAGLLADAPDLAAAFAAVTGASRPLSPLLETDPEALSVLAVLNHRPPITAATPEQLARWKRLEELRIAARDLLDLDPLPETVAALSRLAADVLGAAHRLVTSEGEPPSSPWSAWASSAAASSTTPATST